MLHPSRPSGHDVDGFGEEKGFLDVMVNGQDSLPVTFPDAQQQ
jgi:hypothetical protein